MLVAVVYLNAVYALGEFTQEDHPNAELKPLTQEEFEIISEYYPNYNITPTQQRVTSKRI